MKKMVWTILVTGGSALGAALTARALERLWRRITSEEPPESPRWARLLVGWPIKKTVRRTVEPDTAV
jgi:hypothetical protein